MKTRTTERDRKLSQLLMNEESSDVSRVTRLSSQGRGAVAVISVQGTSSTDHVSQHFVPASRKPLSSFPINRIIFGEWQHADGSCEDIVVCRTSENSFELNCHGGAAAANAIVNALISNGAVEQSAEVWVANHERDSIRSEARLALGDARTERAAAILLDQYRGALRREIEGVIEDLRNDRSSRADERLATLLDRGDVGLHLTKPWRVAFAGPPNVGKSSLMNRLLGYARSIVFDQPGTTRDLLSAPAAFEGWSVELTDTAGLRESNDAVEVAGVTRANAFISAADLTILVFDASCDHGQQQQELLAQNPKALRVINKCDLCDPIANDFDFLATSATTGTGITDLIDQIVKRLVYRQLNPGDAVPFTRGQIGVIDSAREAVRQRNYLAAITTLESLVLGCKPHVEQ